MSPERVADKQPTERGPAVFHPLDYPVLCRVCRCEFVEGDTVFFVGRQIQGAAYIRHTDCARGKAAENPRTENPVAVVCRNGRVIRGTNSLGV